MSVTVTSVLPRLDAAATDSLAAPVTRMLMETLSENAPGAGRLRLLHEETRTCRLDGEIVVTIQPQLHRHGDLAAHAPFLASFEEAVRAAEAEAETLAADAEVIRFLDAFRARLPGLGWGMTPATLDLPGNTTRHFAIKEKDGDYTVTAKYRATLTFTLRRQGALDIALQAADALGPARLADAKIASLFLTPATAEGPYQIVKAAAFLPVGSFAFSLDGRPVKAVAAGLSPVVVEMTPTFDAWVKPGIAALMKLARGPLAQDALLDMALKYRISRMALYGVLQKPRQAVYADVRKAHPAGLSERYMKAAIVAADRAVQALARAAWRRGARVGLAVAALLLCLYFPADLRGRALALLPWPGVFDGLALATAGGAGAAVAFLRAEKHLIRQLGLNSPIVRRPALEAGYLARPLILLAVLFLVTALLAATPPEWALSVRAWGELHLRHWLGFLPY